MDVLGRSQRVPRSRVKRKNVMLGFLEGEGGKQKFGFYSERKQEPTGASHFNKLD